MLLAIAAGNRRPIIPHMEFEYPDSDIHEDLYQLIKYSCCEVCTNEQLDKVMKIWTTFLEPMLGVPSRSSQGTEDTEDVMKSKNQVSRSVAEGDASPVAGTTVTSTKLSSPSRNGDERTSPEQSSACLASLVNGDNGAKKDGPHNANHAGFKTDALCNIPQLGNVPTAGIVGDETSVLSRQASSNEQLACFNTSLAAGTDECHGRTNMENKSGLHSGLYSCVISIYLVILFSDLDIASHSVGFIFCMLMVGILRCSFYCKGFVLLRIGVEMLLVKKFYLHQRYAVGFWLLIYDKGEGFWHNSPKFVLVK